MISFSTVPLPSTSTTVAADDDSRTSWTLRIVAASDFGPTTTAALLGEPGEQVGGLVQHLLEPAVGGGEEVADLARRRRRRAVPGDGEVVDEEAVALVGRDASGRGVRLDQVALLLEHRHLVAHRRRRHADARRAWRCARTRPAARSRCTPARRRSGSRSCDRRACWQSRLPSANRRRRLRWWSDQRLIASYRASASRRSAAWSTIGAG